MSYTSVFGGTTIYPSDVSYLSIALAANVELEWPLESSGTAAPAARIIDVTPAADAYVITMPDATQTGAGQTILFNNLNGGSYSFTINDNAGSQIAVVAPGEQWQVYLAGTATAAGTWRVFQYGASTATVQSATLAGNGIIAEGVELAQATPVTLFNTNLTLTTASRAAAYVWNSTGSGTLSLPAAASAGSGYFFMVRNAGGGDLTIDPNGVELINDSSTVVLQPGDSAMVITNNAGWYTVGLGKQAIFAFDFIAIPITGGTLTLSSSQLNRIAYKFTGTLTSNATIVVPTTVQQYWIHNATTGSFTLSVKAGPTGTPITVNQNYKGIYYCDSTNIVLASDPVTIGIPVDIPSGGTGATTAGAARLNLGITTFADAIVTATTASSVRSTLGASAIGDALFTVADAATARSTISAAESGNNTNITTLRGLSDGSAAAPSVAFSSDTNTGFFRVGADEFSVTTGGTERLRFGPAGQTTTGYSATGAAPTTTAPGKLFVAGNTYTDNTTAVSGTVTAGAMSAFGATTLAATNTTVTYTAASTLYVAGAPTAGTNVTITNPYSVYVAGGTTYLGGNLGLGVTSPTYPIDATSTGLNGLQLTCTDATTTAGPVVSLYRNNTPSNGYDGGLIYFKANSSTGVLRNYGYILMDLTTVTNGAEYGTLIFNTIKNGTQTSMLSIGGNNGLISVSANAALQISKTGVTAPATTDGNVFSGTYTPSATGGTNVTTGNLSPSVCQYMRVGDVVTVSGFVAVTATAGSTASPANTTFTMSLPIASAMTNAAQVAGTAAYATNTVAANSFARLSADTTSDVVAWQFASTTTASANWYFTFTYQVL